MANRDREHSDGPDGSPRAGHVATKALEDAISQIPSVSAVGVVREGDRISEVHIVAGRDRGPKQIVRDVQSVLLAKFGLELDYRTVSIVQPVDDSSAVAAMRGAAPLPAEAQAAATPAPATPQRASITRLSTEALGNAASVAVDLALGGQTHSGSARGPAISALRLVALAVIDAVAGFFDSAIDVDSADILSSGRHKVAVVVLRITTDRADHAVSGSAVIRRDSNDAVARATLSALNRLLQTPRIAS